MNIAEFHFLRPLWFVALLPLLFTLILLYRHKGSQKDWQDVCDADLLPFLLSEKQAPQQRGRIITGAAACLLVILALAGPTWQRLPTPAFRNESALVIALDLSITMDATDVKPSRVGKARYKIADLLKQRKDGLSALLVYSGDAFTVTPLTTDTATISSQLEALATDIMPSSGRNTGLAIHKAVDLLKQTGAVQGHILLITDGVDTDTLSSVSQWLGNYRLSVLAIGTTEGAPIHQAEGGFVKDANGGIVLAKMDGTSLMALANKGGGIFQPVTANDADIETLSKLFNDVRSSEAMGNDLLLQQWDEKGPWLLLLILPWAVLQFRKGLLLWLVLILLPFPRESQAFDWQSLWKKPEWRAVEMYRQGNFAGAAELLKDDQTADGLYNRGNALAQMGQLQDAVDAYDQALKRDPEHQDAKTNKAIVEEKLQEQKKQHQDRDNQADDKKSAQKSEQQPSSAPKNQQQEQDTQDPSYPKQNSNPKEQNASQPQQPAAEQQQPADAPKESAGKEQKDSEQGSNQDEKATKTAKPLETDEQERANQQLLKRIPDEPTGLLRRKFKFQYSQQHGE